MADGRDIVLELIEQRKGDALQKEAADLDRLADKTEVSSRQMRKMSDESSTLNRRIEEQTTKVRALASEIERGDGDDKGLIRQFRNAERDLGNLKRVAKSLEDIVPDVSAAGAKAGTSFMSSLSDAASAGGPELKAALVVAAVGAAAAVAPAIGAAVAGAVAGAVGVGGIAGGIAAAAQDPAVQAAARGLKNVLMGEFTDMGAQFVQPTIAAIGLLEDAARDIDLSHMFGPLAAEVPVLAQALGDMARAMEPGLSRAFAAAAPAIDALAEHLPEIGSALGNMIGDITESKGAMEGLGLILDTVEGTLVLFGGTVTWLSDRFDDMVGIVAPAAHTIATAIGLLQPGWWGLDDLINSNVEAMNRWRGAGDGVAGTAGHLASTVLNAANAANGLATANRNSVGDTAAAEAAAKTYTKALEDQKRALDGAFNSQMALDRANLAVAGEWDALKAAVEANGRSLDATSAKGRANRGVILDQIGALENQRDAAIAAGDGSEAGMKKANAAFNRGIDKLVALAAKAGLSKSALEAMAKDYKITITEYHRYIDQHTTDLPPKPKRNALGGRTFANEPVIVGDGGRPELFIPDTNGYIAPRVPASMSGGGGSPGGGSGRQFSPLRVDESSVAALLIQILQNAAQRQFGGNAVVMLSTR